MFKAGDTVKYTGWESKFLRDKIGIVLEHSPRRGYLLADVVDTWDTVPVEWQGYGYYGVYAKNIEPIYVYPEWEV